ncbi:MAG: hypothetical protein LBC99_01395 [Spirochaetota bacterium]|jgi:hypothetical protein|nr:hypothetical protein [Spirochaetota bacterium]
MKTTHFMLCLAGAVLLVFMAAACGSDANSIFNTKTSKSYIRSIDFRTIRTAAPAVINGITRTNLSKYDYEFDKTVLEYTILVQGEPETATLNIVPDSTDIDAVYTVFDVNIGETLAAANVDFSSANEALSGQDYSVNINRAKDTIVAVKAKSRGAGDQETIYTLRFRNAHKDMSLKSLIPWHPQPTFRASYSHLEPYYNARISDYSLTFLSPQMQLLAVPNNQYIELRYQEGGVPTAGTLVPYQTTDVYQGFLINRNFPDAMTINYTLLIKSEDRQEERTLHVQYTRTKFVYTGDLWSFTTEPYAFDGGIKTLKDNIKSKREADQFFYSETDPIRIRGVVTGLGFGFPRFVPYPGEPEVAMMPVFVLEDANDGILVAYQKPEFAPADPEATFSFGDIIEVSILHGMYHYNEPVAVWDHTDNVARVGRVDSLHYMPVVVTDCFEYPYDSQNAVHRAKRDRLQGKMLGCRGWSGRRSSGGSNEPAWVSYYMVPTAADAGSGQGYNFQVRGHNWLEGDSWYALLADGEEHTFYGPAFFSSSVMYLNVFHPGMIDTH